MAEDYNFTIFKSGYHYGDKHCQMFLNYGYGNHPESFSIVLKKGNFTLIHNLTKDEKLSFVKSVFNKLTEDEKKVLLNQ